MCDCITFKPLSIPIIKFQKLGLRYCKLWQSYPKFHSVYVRNRISKFVSTRTSRIPGVLGSEEYGFYDEFEFRKKGKEQFELDSQLNKDLSMQNDMDIDLPGLDDLELKEKKSRENKRRLKAKNLVQVEESGNANEPEKLSRRVGLRVRKQVIKRSNIIAKQVISIQSALSLGFVSQIWVDTNSWMVPVVEVRPSLLSGELERFLLEDVSQVGDVLLVEDESVMENELKMVGLETLVGYRVVTPGQRDVGKVRGYSFNVNSGAVESLELDSFGISIIPSSLVSTYALSVEDVLEVLPDTVVIHEAAASRIQRLTKGFWDAQNVRSSIDEAGEARDYESSVRSYRSRNKRRSVGSRNPQRKTRVTEDDWELPLDYL